MCVCVCVCVCVYIYNVNKLLYSSVCWDNRNLIFIFNIIYILIVYFKFRIKN